MTQGRTPTTLFEEDHEMLAAAFEATAIGLCFLDAEGRILRANPALCAMLGHAREELIGRPWTLIAPPQIAALGARFLSTLPADTSRFTSEWALPRKDGTRLNGLVSIRVLTVGAGQRRIVISVSDNDERREAEEKALRRSRDLYRDVVENVGEAIVVVQDGRVILANPRAVELSGYSADELLDMSFSNLVHPEDLAATIERYQRRVAGIPASSRYAHFRIQRRDGEALWMESSAVTIEWEGRSAMLAFLSDQSVRRRHELALIKSEEHHRQVVDNATEGIVVVQDGVIVFANSRMQEITGIEVAALHGRSFLADIHPDDRAEADARYRRRMAGKAEPTKVTLRAFNSRSGAYAWLEVAVVVIDWEGRPAILSFLTDITERKALEDRLKQSLDERETILENSIVGMVFLNAAGRVHWANGAMFQIFRIRGEMPNGQSLEPYYPSREAYLQTGAAVAAAVSKGSTFETELQMRRADGSLFWAYLSGRAVNPTDLSRGTVWVVMDISRRRELEAALNKSEEHYREVVNNVTECIFVVQDGHIVFANPRLFQLTGYTEEDLFELPFMTAIHPDDRPLVVERHLRRLRGEDVEQYYQFRVVNRRTEVVIWVQLSAVMIEWEGRPATLSFMTDITERKRLEDSLKQSMAERIRLETLHIQGELKEAELARRHAEDTTRAKSMFLANMSHEIRTPMNAIIGMAHLALRTELDAKQREYIEKIHGAGLSLLGIINDILDFSKIEAGKLDVERIPFSLDEMFGNVAAVTAANAHRKQIEYVIQCPLDVPRALVGDPLRLGQVLINLVNNAVKFTERGEVHVTCRCLETSAEQVQLQFVVRDSGIGMTAEQTQRLFQAFSQADESTTRKYGGTGLGLSIAKRLVELMDGAIWLDSAPGAGTTIRFTAWFGLRADAHQEIALPQPLHDMRVLLVDDHAGARLALADGLGALPLRVDQAASAGEALHMIHQADAEAPYSVVLAGARLGGLDGIELATAVKTDTTLNLPPRLVLLAADSGDDAMRGRIDKAPLDAWLMKPVHAATVVRTLVKLCAPGMAAPDHHGEHGARSSPRFRDLVILLVEDNEINQQIAAEMLRVVGIETDIAANGRIALTMLDAAPRRYGMVFMDVQMPEMDGHEATRRLRLDPRFTDLPIVAMTAHAMVEERERCFAAGMNAHLAKPVNPPLLYRTVARWCPQHVVMAQTPATTDAGVETLPEIPGLDMQGGLKRALGDQSFYRQMLGRFRDGQRDTVAGIRQALEQDRDLAYRLAHTLRGVAGLLGAHPLHGLCGALEEEIGEGRESDALRPLLDELDATLQGLHHAIDNAFPDLAPASEGAASMAAASEPAAAAFDRALAQDELAHLAALLRESDAEATEFVARQRELLTNALGAGGYQRLARQVSGYEFEAALATLAASAAEAGYTIH